MWKSILAFWIFSALLWSSSSSSSSQQQMFSKPLQLSDEKQDAILCCPYQNNESCAANNMKQKKTPKRRAATTKIQNIERWALKNERKYKIWNEIKIHFNTNDGHLSAAKYHTSGETIIQTWIACRVLSVSFNRNIYLANGSTISCLHENAHCPEKPLNEREHQRDKQTHTPHQMNGKMYGIL